MKSALSIQTSISITIMDKSSIIKDLMVFNIVGGLHHAMFGKVPGFCCLNCLGVAILYLVSLRKKKHYL